MSARRAKQLFKPRREGDLTVVNITGFFLPWNGKAPALLTPETSTVPLVPLFESEQDLRGFMARAEFIFTEILQIPNQADFLNTWPRQIEIAVNPRFDADGTMSYDQIQRGS